MLSHLNLFTLDILSPIDTISDCGLINLMAMTKALDKNVFDVVKQAVSVAIDEAGLVTKKDLKYLPTKDEFYQETLKVLKKLDDIEEQMTMLSNRTYDNTDRIENLEKLRPQGKHRFRAAT